MTIEIGKTYKLIGADGKFYESEIKGTLGGHRKDKIYGTIGLQRRSALARQRFLRQTARFLRR